jgi:glucuronate isomerase
MSLDLRRRIFDELDSLVLIDPHTHINPHAPASRTLADILGYHYYTELAHSAGMPRAEIEEPDGKPKDLDPKEKVRRLVRHLAPLENTVQYSWLIEMCQTFFGFADDRITPDNREALFDAAAARMAEPDWEDQVLRRSKLEAVFLTNDFDDPLKGFDTRRYVPCLRTDDLVFHLARPKVRERLEEATSIALRDSRTLRHALGKLFDHFTARGARACAISLPPDFAPRRIDIGDDLMSASVDKALVHLLKHNEESDEACRHGVGHFVFWTLAEMCRDYRLPFDLMIGVNRAVYRGGVYQGQDLFDSRVSLIQYRELFNAFPEVTFPISVLASVTNQELVAYSWIFPNVVTNGHWWYSNTPAYIEHDTAARLEAVPATKQIGYYSDMYKLEFALPKFAMYKRVLAKVLAERFVLDRAWSETRAIDLGRQVLRGNVERVFGEQASTT